MDWLNIESDLFDHNSTNTKGLPLGVNALPPKELPAYDEEEEKCNRSKEREVGRAKNQTES